MTWIGIYIIIGALVSIGTYIYQARAYDKDYRFGYDDIPDHMEPLWFALGVGVLWGLILAFYLIMLPLLMFYKVIYKLARNRLSGK